MCVKSDAKSVPKIYVFEGIDNVGKTTLTVKLNGILSKEFHKKCELITFPGREDKTLGKVVYDIHHNEKYYFDYKINDISLQLLHVASHIDIIKRKIINSSNELIIMDRFWWSTYVYGLAGGIQIEEVKAILKPELIQWKNIKVNKIFLIEREDRNKEYEISKDILIISNYRALAAMEKNCKIIYNNGSLEDVLTQILDEIREDF